MKINRNNYELWMIDYFDGILNANEISQLLSFIDLHPDIKEEFESFDNIGLEAEIIEYTTKNELKKNEILPIGPINENNYEDLFIAYHENDLKADQKQEIEEFISINPFLQKEFKLHGNLQLEANKTIIFEEKENLRKRPVIGFYWWAGAAAAAVVLLFGIFSLLNQSVNPQTNRFASISLLNKKSIDLQAHTHQPINYIQPSLKSPEIFTAPVSRVSDSDFVNHTAQTENLINGFQNIATLDKQSIIDLNSTYFDYALLEIKTNDFNEVYFASAEPTAKKSKKGNLLGRIIKNYAKKVNNEVPSTDKSKDKKEPGFVKILDQSITVFNTLTGSDTEMLKSYDEEGNLTKYQVEGESISWGKDYASRKPSE